MSKPDLSSEYIKDPDIMYVYLRDIADKNKKNRNTRKMTPLVFPLTYNEWGKIVKPFGEKRGMYHKNLKSV